MKPYLLMHAAMGAPSIREKPGANLSKGEVFLRVVVKFDPPFNLSPECGFNQQCFWQRSEQSTNLWEQVNSHVVTEIPNCVRGTITKQLLKRPRAPVGNR